MRLKMKRTRLSHALPILIAATVLCVSLARAQQPPAASPSTDSGAPAQPLPPLPAGSDSNQTSLGANSGSASVPAQPDTHVLSGAETLGLGSLHRLTRIFDPALQVSEFGETGVVAGKTLSVTSVGGSLDVEHHWRRSDLTVAYRGGDTFYRPSFYGTPNLPYHNGTISERVFLGRWTLLLRDDVLYSWGSSFGGLFAGGATVLGENSSLSNIQPSLTSSGTIQTALARQIYNTAVTEADYAFTRRTTLTFAGSYGLQHFLDSGYIDSQNATGRLGYNYALSGKNNLALTYDHNLTTFTGVSSRLESDLVQAAFGRKITGRLAFQIAAGPQLLHFYHFGLSNTKQLTWSASSSLSYERPRTTYSLSYFRGVSAGSGVFFGSRMETVTATGRRELTKRWSASIYGGYASNHALVPAAVFASNFDNWFAGARLNRPIGRQLSFGLSYVFEQQTSGVGSCPVRSCGLPGSFSQYGLTLEWHPLLVRAR
jgi:hypothetical protein